MDKKVSVVIPTYKRSKFLQRAINSVLNQTYSNIEIIVVDDNDPNSKYRVETEKKMLKYIDCNNVIYIKNKKNLGGALARNEGILKASGDYITFLDDDDVYLPDKVSSQIKYMIENELDMSFTDVRIHNMDDKLVDYREHNYVKNLSNEELLKQHIMHHLTPTATYMFKKKSILNVGGFDDVQMGQEFMLMLKAIESGLKIGYLPVAHVIQYIHDGERISVGQNKIKAEVELYNFKKKYFNILNFRQRRYVKFRHHAVMMIVGKRSKQPIIAIQHLMKAFLTSPIDCILETIYHIKKINKYKTLAHRIHSS
ncbi:Glycosyltransferase, GT2 family [Caminicella sporogenes DSM 14501]|uniref:Glycosyltransferase, GT2 family n=1 Tax=Caminicella sporogenes DSM 14501 TaxID=1121266 RepID=A0A1M6PVT8_9FIRM|nr:glycosyltransferase family 2 protein [Caminicella sporogenes]RKD21951.1 hypothetical protein BET04_06785 [Caminicella sporogenes]SHK12049.1 Glycosyltransferase, GT2 family [Caminicella sporogenes DSM 14501]